MHELTPPQLTYLAREALVDFAGSVVGKFGSTLRQNIEQDHCTQEDLLVRYLPEEIEAYKLAQVDFAKARAIMEEHAAFAWMFTQVAAEFPTMAKRLQQREARLRLKDPEWFKAAVASSEVYPRLDRASV